MLSFDEVEQLKINEIKHFYFLPKQKNMCQIIKTRHNRLCVIMRIQKEAADAVP